MYLAHSKTDKVKEQSYKDHIEGVYNKCLSTLKEIKPYVKEEVYNSLEFFTLEATEYHDLGKLCEFSQLILSGKQKGKMPNHVDAGTAYLLKKGNPYSAWLVHAHHIGLEDYDTNNFRDIQNLDQRCQWIGKNCKMEDYTNSILDELIEKHNQSVHFNKENKKLTFKPDSQFMRIALSILVDADHYDTAKNYKNYVIEETIDLQPQKRLNLLNSYIEKITDNSTQRNRIKGKVYINCRDSENNDPISFCASEVGTGKTTALMANALSRSVNNNLKRIFYVAPFTSIISQNVNVYRKSLVDDTENEKIIVAEHHHQIEYDLSLDSSIKSKMFTQLWNSPIIATTAVQFFETLAGNKTGKLRKLHNIIGSVIIIDESHSNIPSELWPVTLIWIKNLAENYGCHVIFASGSIIKPWKVKQFGTTLDINSIISEELTKETLQQEKDRVKITYSNKENTLQEIYGEIIKYKGSKLVICNTIKNAARIANYIKNINGKEYVEHISTCLTPNDREIILKRVINRLKNNPNDDWTLVATSCIEAGVDISFKYGFRENAGLLSVLQTAGRIRRNNENHWSDSVLNVFELKIDKKMQQFSANNDLSVAIEIFKQFYEYDRIGPEWAEKSFIMEVNKKKLDFNNILSHEKGKQTKSLKGEYNVINGEKFTAIVNLELLNELLEKDFITSSDKTNLIRNSVQIYESKKDTLSDKIEQIEEMDGLYKWKGNYDPDFLGYMVDLL